MIDYKKLIDKELEKERDKYMSGIRNDFIYADTDSVKFINYEKLWNRLRDLIHAHEEAEDKMYHRSRSESVRTYLHGKMDGFLAIEEMMDSMEEEANDEN